MDAAPSTRVGRSGLRPRSRPRRARTEARQAKYRSNRRRAGASRGHNRSAHHTDPDEWPPQASPVQRWEAGLWPNRRLSDTRQEPSAQRALHEPDEGALARSRPVERATRHHARCLRPLAVRIFQDRRPRQLLIRCGRQPQRSEDFLNPFVGLIALFPYQFTPEGWFNCDGQVVPVAEYQPLFSLIGNQFGGDGEQTFVLPKLDGPAPGLRYCIAFEGIYPSPS